MFQFPGLASTCLCIQHEMTSLQDDGFSHSEICGSMLVCNSPQLIAAYHVLHRLSMPRHPPNALTYLSLMVLHTSDEVIRRSFFGDAINTLAFSLKSDYAAVLRLTLRNSIMSKNGPACPTSVIGSERPGNRACGVRRVRTADPLLAKQVLYQLSYNPA